MQVGWDNALLDFYSNWVSSPYAENILLAKFSMSQPSSHALIVNLERLQTEASFSEKSVI